MAAAAKWLVSVVVLLAVAAFASSQNCSEELGSLSVCAPFVVPGATPSGQCCRAVQQVDRGCLCNTARIIAQIPTSCSLPPINCAAGP